MRRTDRLFDLIQILRDGRLHRASEISERLGVSIRTIWRDMNTLMASGLPVEGERGVGYILRAPITLPPMILNAVELEALRLGLRLATEGPRSRRLARPRALWPSGLRPSRLRPATTPTICSPSPARPRQPRAQTPARCCAAPSRRTSASSITYIDPRGTESHRDIRPLALEKHAQNLDPRRLLRSARRFSQLSGGSHRGSHRNGRAFPR